MGIRVRVLPGVAPSHAAEARRVARGFAKVSGVRHDIRVVVVPFPAVRADHGTDCYGTFHFPRRRRCRPTFVVVAGQVPRDDYRRGFVGAGSVRCVGHTILHELAHYEQWRDRRPMVERGVNVRARNLYRLIDARG